MSYRTASLLSLLKFRGKYVTSVDGAESGEVLHMVLRSPLLGGAKQG